MGGISSFLPFGTLKCTDTRLDRHIPDIHRPDGRTPGRHRADRHRPDRHRADRHRPDRHRPDTHRPGRHRPDRHRPDQAQTRQTPAARPTDRPAARPTDRPAGRPTDRPAARPTGRPFCARILKTGWVERDGGDLLFSNVFLNRKLIARFLPPLTPHRILTITCLGFLRARGVLLLIIIYV